MGFRLVISYISGGCYFHIYNCAMDTFFNAGEQGLSSSTYLEYGESNGRSVVHEIETETIWGVPLYHEPSSW